MTILGGQKETLLTGLSAFWQTLFADKDKLNTLYEGTEELLGQAYLDLLTEVLNVNLADMPLFNKEYWHLLTLREDNLRYEPNSGLPYFIDLDEPLVDAEFLFNRIYDPSWAWERGTHFEVERGRLRFLENPFDEALPGVASRRVHITPTVYREGNDGVYTANDPEVFQVKGLVKHARDGESFSNRMFRSMIAEFDSDDVGRVLIVSQGSTSVEKIISSVVDAHTLRVEVPFGFTGEEMYWEIRDTVVFTNHDVDDVLVLDNPAEAGDLSEYVIHEVLDGTTVKLDRSIEFTPTEHTGIPWTHQSTETVTELAFWVPDAMFDRENMYLSFGYLINRKQPSSESYRALIQGIFQFFLLGPALSRIEAALNVMVGVPVVQEDGEVVEYIGVDEVRTQRRTYRVPEGSVRQTLNVGDSLSAFESLTHIFTVTDYTDQSDWMYGKRIPQELVHTDTALDANVDPNLYDTTIGGGKPWRVGDPYVFIGADFDGEPVNEDSGYDLSIDAVAQQVTSRVFKFKPHHVGRKIEVEGVKLEITNVSGIYATADVNASSNALSELADKISDVDVELVHENPYIVRCDGSRGFEQLHDAGMVVEDNENALWRIARVLDNDTLELELLDAESGTYNVGDAFTLSTSLKWSAPYRPALRHNPGYNLAHDFLKYHICYLSYDLNRWDIPHLQPQQDIRDVIIEGTPSHVYVMFSPDNLVESSAVVRQKSYSVGIHPTEDLHEKDGALSLDGSWSVGDYYQYATPETAWVEVLRPTDIGEVVELKGAVQATDVIFTPDIPTGYVELYTYLWNGQEFVATGDVYEAGPGVTQDIAQVNVEGRTAIRVEAMGLPDTDVYVPYGVRAENRSIILLQPDSSVSVDGGGTLEGNFKATTYKFHAFDLWRALEIEVDNERTNVYISEVVAADEVSLTQLSDGTPFNVPQRSAQFTFGVPQQVASPLLIGGSNPDTDAGSIKSWPVLVNYAE